MTSIEPSTEPPATPAAAVPEGGGADFTDFVRGRSTALLRSTILLTGGDRALAEDLLQTVLERMYLRWRRIQGSPEAYARRSLVHAAINSRRSRHRRPELPLFDGFEVAAGGGDATAAVDQRDLLVRVLLTLPARQRAVLVLRYFDDLSEVDTAAALGCSVGTVKSTASRALARLREGLPADHPVPAPGGTR